MSGLFTPFSDAAKNNTVKTDGDSVSGRDLPITKISEDRFERSAYSAQLANIICDVAPWGASTVFSLTGQWGSGKTSLVNLIRSEESLSNEKWTIVDFNPWVASDPQSLIEEFYRVIVGTVPDDKTGQKIKTVLQKTFSTIGSIAGGVGGFGVLEALALSKGVDAANAVYKTWKQEQDSWPTLYTRAANHFKDLNKRILIVVDDIDRLHTDELALLMKVIRLLGRFPQVNYLLVYEEESLLTTLARSTAVGGSEDDALRFMEKIVQYPFDVPPLTSFQIEKELSALFDKLFQGVSLSGDPEDFALVKSRMFDVWEKTLVTPRLLHRFAALLTNWTRIYGSGEVNGVDLTILATIRIVFPSVYKRLSRAKEVLLQGGRTTGSQKPGWEKQLCEGMNNEQMDLLKTMLLFLFPRLSDHPSTRMHRERGISTEVYFDTYLMFQRPGHVISDEQLDKYLSNADDAMGFVDLINSDDNDMVASVMKKLPLAIDRLDGEGVRHMAVEVLFTAANGMHDKGRQVRMSGIFSDLYSHACSILGALPQLPVEQLYEKFFSEMTLNEAAFWLNQVGERARACGNDVSGLELFRKVNIKTEARILSVLKNQDPSDWDLGPYSLGILAKSSNFSSVLKSLQSGIEEHQFDVIDIGVLFLTTVYSSRQGPSGGAWIDSFQHSLFSRYVPDSLRAITKSEVDVELGKIQFTDFSWEGKRKVVAYALETGRSDFTRERLGGYSIADSIVD
ncbi:KAP family NTPase [Corynebacterium glutamicum]|uniref:KAP NTPase domain-containing protein n=1 Tax=Corynebacterium glutamicum (strain ATCC 13032 / DSM 20300 / JCM 1318 / BCRC 11384 / CCUG 27702 / LMG 3730 / NBRC 12168 / NCIMB 10025 / NRRL B-2784 / 534) TaxID=196627 RepID=Q8NPT4_CORGL|nr:KAP family P-loop domain protein [Corynebacterium glutamicum]NII99660.1 putative KAP-like P-loop ATPase [Corynebacterium glutamicum]WBG73454.1 KAP family P-loop domain protein [Corynebacterium glutamicum]BAB99120.1 Hypothetical protein [Corynebacterium glutamicum ATCC 13032]